MKQVYFKEVWPERWQQVLAWATILSTGFILNTPQVSTSAAKSIDLFFSFKMCF